MPEHLLPHSSRSGQFLLQTGHQSHLLRLSCFMETGPQRRDAHGQSFQFLPFMRKHRREQIWLNLDLFAVIPFSTA
jgi:hypothetical protein